MPRLKCVELCLPSPIHLHGVVVNQHLTLSIVIKLWLFCSQSWFAVTCNATSNVRRSLVCKNYLSHSIFCVFHLTLNLHILISSKAQHIWFHVSVEFYELIISAARVSHLISPFWFYQVLDAKSTSILFAFNSVPVSELGVSFLNFCSIYCVTDKESCLILDEGGYIWLIW